MSMTSFEALRERFQESSIMPNDIKVEFDLPGGKRMIAMFPKGQTIGYLKSFLDRHFSYGFDCIELYRNRKELPDPFSMSDVGFTDENVNLVNVVLVIPPPRTFDDIVAVDDDVVRHDLIDQREYIFEEPDEYDGEEFEEY